MMSPRPPPQPPPPPLTHLRQILTPERSEAASTQPEPYAIELEQGRRRSIPPPPLYPLSEGTAVSPESDFAAPRYVQPIGHLAGQSRSPRDRRLSNTPLSQSPGPSYTTGNKRTFEETLSPAHKPASLQNTPRGSFSSELELLRSILPPRPMSDNLRLVVRQQPVAARACGFGERDRRVIDPPPIVQLVASDPSNPSSESDVRYPFNVVHCTLWNVAGTADETALEQQDKRLTRRLMGTLVASPFIGQDENNEDGTFFCFPDLSCRTHGKFRLKFVLMCIDPMGQQASYTPVTTEVMSDVFTVYTAKEFPGMRPSTGLTKALKQQGCAISVKKGNEKASQASPQEEDEEKSGEGDDSDQDTASRGKRRRKA
ncbi:hypothetical protein TWF192_001096 [Orbilia oligospora]|nr:hypothetical protein TWF192_001096 [Orbilia oligospora]